MIIDDLKRVAVDIISEESLAKKLESGKKLVIKFGADPSRPDLHLGHSVALRQLKKLQDAGHEIVFVIGDFTAMIGDPSGKSKTRPSLTFEETRKSGETYFKQVSKILDPERTRIVYNSEWLSKMGFDDVVKLAGKYTLARLMERDDFAKRYANNTPIGIHELLYPLMQGYDSVAIKADVEVGGSDQTFNLLVGRELQKDYGQDSQDVITFPLLVGLDGKEKMSKSLDNYIGLDEPSEIMFEKCMKVPDDVLETYFRLTTDVEEYEYKKVMLSDVREAHFMYAKTIVSMYHGEDKVEDALKRYLEVASGAIPTNVKDIEVEEDELTVIQMLVKAGFAASSSQARQLISGKGVKVNNEVVTEFFATFNVNENPVISKGKNNFARFIKK